MGKAVPQQHPAVVLRSHYNHLRALLIAALIAVLGLAGAVVIVANDDETVVSTSTPAIESGGTGATADIAPGVNIPARPNQAQPFLGVVKQAQQEAARRHDIRMDLRRLQAGGGTNEGSADVTMSAPIGASSVLSQSGGYRYDGGPNEGSADVTTAKPGAVPQTGSPRYDGGPNEGSAEVTTGHSPLRGSAPVMPQSDGWRFVHPAGN